MHLSIIPIMVDHTIVVHNRKEYLPIYITNRVLYSNLFYFILLSLLSPFPCHYFIVKTFIFLTISLVKSSISYTKK
ncbi:hypothetical protein VitviT2T_007604 [Vitis vinifera]|uniref:Uncharacterized protein n=1 Tax=Vitis vinifera TaxID=29760 RepID=A0ABY9BZ67_VITVI|nr:hypothetical protein VitviT2T_007604 [Vitis vinifera]